MDLIHEQYGLPAIHAHIVLGALNHFLHVLLSGNRGINLFKISAGGIGNHLGQGGLSRTGRAIENNGPQLIRFDCAVKQFIHAHYMLLPHHLVQGPGPEPGCQRGFCLHCILSHIIK